MIRAAVFDGPGRPLRFECFARPDLAPGEALVRNVLCTICGSDLHTFAGRRSGPAPCVLGHESVGIVEELGGELLDVGNAPIRVGDRVVWAVAVSCRRCFFCTRGLPQKCASLRKYGHEPVNPMRGPLGGLATHCHLLADSAVVKVPDELLDEVVAPAGCATATVAAAWRVACVGSPTLRQTVVVLGLGMLGLTACAWAAVDGHAVVACDVSADRLRQAARFGAARAVKPPEVVELVHSLTEGRGADLALELSGSPAAAKLSLDVLRIGGKAVWVGAVSPTDPVSVQPETIVRRCLTVTGIHNYAPHDLAAAVGFLANHHTRFPFGELVARTFPLDDATAAFHFAEAEHSVRVAVAPDFSW